MSEPCVCLTGFGAFPGVDRNPTEELARALGADPPPGVSVRSAVLPVTFAGVPGAWDALLASEGPAPHLLLSLGVHPGESFRLESRARGVLSAPKPDNDGVLGEGLVLEDGVDRETSLPLEELAEELRAAGAAPVEVSTDAGGYVCDRTLHYLLGRAAERSIPGLFLHVPPLEQRSVPDQLAVLRAWLPRLAARARAMAGV